MTSSLNIQHTTLVFLKTHTNHLVFSLDILTSLDLTSDLFVSYSPVTLVLLVHPLLQRRGVGFFLRIYHHQQPFTLVLAFFPDDTLAPTLTAF